MPDATPTAVGTIRADGSSQVTANGVTEAITPPGTGLLEARSAVTGHVARQAAVTGPVVMEVTDPEVRVQLMVHPDGTVSYLSVAESTAPAEAAAPEAAPVAAPSLPADGIDETHRSVAAPPAPATGPEADLALVDETRISPVDRSAGASRPRRRDYAAALSAAQQQPETSRPVYSEFAFAPPSERPTATTDDDGAAAVAEAGPAEAAEPQLVAHSPFTLPAPGAPAAPPAQQPTPALEVLEVAPPSFGLPESATPTTAVPLGSRAFPEAVTSTDEAVIPTALVPMTEQPQPQQQPAAAPEQAFPPAYGQPQPPAPEPSYAQPQAPAAPVPYGQQRSVQQQAAPPTRAEARASFLQANDHEAPASQGWRGAMQRIGIKVAPSQSERAERADESAVAQHWPGTRTVAVVNGKGGAGKTPTTAMLAAVFARQGGGGVLAWDNNETRGTLGWRTEQGSHVSTVRDLLPRTDDLLAPSARAAEVSYYVHHQTQDKYDVLRSAPHLLSAHQRISGTDFDAVHDVASKYFRLLLIDSGNDEAAEHWLRMIDHAHQIVVPLRAEDEHAEAAALLLEELAARDEHSAQLAARAVVVVSEARKDAATKAQTIASGFRTMVRSAVVIPYDPAMVGGLLRFESLKQSTQRAWLGAAAEVSRGL